MFILTATSFNQPIQELGYVQGDEYVLYVSIRYFVQPTYWELGYVQGDEYAVYVSIRQFVQPTYWELGHVQGDDYAIICLVTLLRSTNLLGVGTRPR